MRTPEHIILPGTENELLRRELAHAFSSLGCRVSLPNPARLHDASYPLRLTELLDGRPALLFSINGHGLAFLRPTLEILNASGSIAAIWFVDNPWNVLSGVRDPRWRALPLFATDASFIPALKANGAEHACHLPLACAPEFFAPDVSREGAFSPPGNMAPFVFVGRSSFPGKREFFAGQTVPQALQTRAQAMLLEGQRPDLNWWEEQLDVSPLAFWPGKKARLPALGAEETNLAWRGLCLRQAAALGGRDTPGLDVFGDPGWEPYLGEGARLRPPVDYYTRLPAIYARARFNLCLTSLQLPQGLNQRHFDIWTAGGLCLSDATPGLSLFPEELVRPMRFHKAQDIPAIAAKLEAEPARTALIADWRSYLLQHHTYAHRAARVLQCLDEGNDCPPLRAG